MTYFMDGPFTIVAWRQTWLVMMEIMDLINVFSEEYSDGL